MSWRKVPHHRLKRIIYYDENADQVIHHVCQSPMTIRGLVQEKTHRAVRVECPCGHKENLTLNRLSEMGAQAHRFTRTP